jgi:AraC family transcriptional regulator, regulatory protein of adaptative response / methylphosphotriester-DNA alkyltransferase methyltransferase
VCESDTGASAPARDARGRIDLEIAGLRVATGGWVADRRCGWAGRLRGSPPVDHARPGQRPLSRSGLSVGFSSVRVSGGHPSLRPPVVHRARTAEGLSGLYRERCAIVWRHYRRPLTVAVVAGALASSPRQVQRAFAEVGETSFSAHLRAVRLRNAALLLARQPLTVRQVALLVDYRQPAHFAKAFRRRYGVTPAQYRERARRRMALRAVNKDQGGRER